MIFCIRWRGRSILGWLDGARASQAMAGEIDPVCVMDDAIEDGVGIGRIADQLVPFVDGHLAGHALWPSADESQLLPTPVGPHRIKFSCASIQLPSVSFWNSARSRPCAAR